MKQKDSVYLAVFWGILSGAMLTITVQNAINGLLDISDTVVFLGAATMLYVRISQALETNSPTRK